MDLLQAAEVNMASIKRHRNAQKALEVTPSDEEKEMHSQLKKRAKAYLTLQKKGARRYRLNRAAQRFLNDTRSYLDRFVPNADIKL